MEKYLIVCGPDEDTDWDDVPTKEQENDHSDYDED